MVKQIINAIIQARMDSTRLPGKVLMDIEDIPILEHIIRRLRAVNAINTIIIATSDKSDDDVIEAFCQERSISCVRGSKDNVLNRFGKAAKQYPADIFIRATGDNPMIDVNLIEEMISFFNNHDLTYTSYKNYPIGSGVEIFTNQALIDTLEHADMPFEYEHVTPYMYQRMPMRKIEYYISNVDESKLRMTIDTESDLIFAKEVFRRLYKDKPFFGISDINKLLLEEPDLGLINADIHQKTLGE